MTNERDYVLGTNDAELERLGLQNRIWRAQAVRAWRSAGFASGQVILDIGAGPGFATLDLAELVGPTGKVVALERSRRFLDALEAAAAARNLRQVETHELDLDADPLPVVNADGAWARWVFCFVNDPKRLLARTAAALRPGGTIALHEYVDYRAWRLSPPSPIFEEFVDEVMASWRANGGEPDIAIQLPGWLDALGFDLLVARPISEFTRPGDFVWAWPKAFVGTGIARLVELGRIDAERARAMREAFEVCERTAGGFCITPTVLEVVARKRG